MPPRARIVAPGRRRSAPKTTQPEPIKVTDAHLDARIVSIAPSTDPGVEGEVFEPQYEAHKLRLSGMPWPEVARVTGYGSAKSAAMAVSVYLQRAAAAMSAQRMQEALQTQVDRYEAVLNAWWEAGTAGVLDAESGIRQRDDKAAGIVLRTLERLDRVQRLTDGDVQITRETIVISADPDEYVRQLQAAAAEQSAG